MRLHLLSSTPRQSWTLRASRVNGLAVAGPEIPLSGKVLRIIEQRVDLELDLELDLLLDEYGAALDGYLTRVQMLDFMV